MEDASILDRISDLMAREHQLRAARLDGDLDEGEELHELKDTEVQLDQCWDLLRQRRAKREFGRDPKEAHARPARVVEGYWQ